jgi:hypothetical protein
MIFAEHQFNVVAVAMLEKMYATATEDGTPMTADEFEGWLTDHPHEVTEAFVQKVVGWGGILEAVTGEAE